MSQRRLLRKPTKQELKLDRKELRDHILQNGLCDSFKVKSVIDIDSILQDSSPDMSDSIFVNVVATHSDMPINNRLYPKRYMRAGVLTWMLPHAKPVLRNHDEYQDPIGRVVDAKYVNHPKNVKEDAPEYMKVGSGHQELKLKVSGYENVQKVRDGRYDTGSVRFSTNHMWCSICKTDLLNPDADSECEHWPGKTYDGETCLLITGDLDYKEYSFVNMPADEFTKVLNIQEDSLKGYCIGVDWASVCAESRDSSEVAPEEESDDLPGKGVDTLDKEKLAQNKSVQELISEAVAAKAEELDAANAKIEELEKTLEDAAASTETIKGLEEAQAALAREKDELTAKVEELSGQITEKDQEISNLQDDNSNLKSEVHLSLAERLADLRIAKRRVESDKRDEVVDGYKERSADSLRDSIADILGEKVEEKQDEIEDPSLAHEDNTNSDSASDEEPSEETKASRIRRGLNR
jgi:hypothetical protein